MKREIKSLLNQDKGTLRLNNIAYLERLQTDIMGNDVDILRIIFDRINDVDFSGRSGVTIKSRDYDGIIQECTENINTFLSSVSAELCTNLKAGYRNKE